MKKGDKVKYKKKLKGLEFGEIGNISSIHKANEHNKDDWASIVYLQNLNKNVVSCHSAKLVDLIDVDFIVEKMKFYAQNIKEFGLGQIIYDGDKECVITNMTKNSIEVFMEKNKKEGIDCKQWFTIKDFNSEFKVK